jgi:hypothetical protein
MNKVKDSESSKTNIQTYHTTSTILILFVRTSDWTVQLWRYKYVWE